MYGKRLRTIFYDFHCIMIFLCIAMGTAMVLESSKISESLRKNISIKGYYE